MLTRLRFMLYLEMQARNVLHQPHLYFFKFLLGGIDAPATLLLWFVVVGDDTVKLWDIRQFRNPLCVADNLCNLYPMYVLVDCQLCDVSQLDLSLVHSCSYTENSHL